MNSINLNPKFTASPSSISSSTDVKKKNKKGRKEKRKKKTPRRNNSAVFRGRGPSKVSSRRNYQKSNWQATRTEINSFSFLVPPSTGHPSWSPAAVETASSSTPPTSTSSSSPPKTSSPTRPPGSAQRPRRPEAGCGGGRRERTERSATSSPGRAQEEGRLPEVCSCFHYTFRFPQI